MNIKTLCDRIGMPESVTQWVCTAEQNLDFDKLSSLSLLMDGENGLHGFQELTASLGDDVLGIKQLACQLYCACLRYDTYQKLSIPEEIYFDTMSCFARFVTECLYYKGGYQFDRGWWTWRQLSMRVFRLGQLEYEMRPEGFVAMHIPTGSDLSPEEVDRSVEKAKTFFAKFFPEYSDVPFTCNSWLLSRSLEQLLPEKSNILSFRRRFTLTGENPEAMEYVSWLFQRSVGVDPKDFPENTSLQRNAKRFILSGGKIGSAVGYFMTDKE